ncbi:MAG: hypothetical protein FWG02_02430 [Holophagaceae bacterium]|nr:hypothetical protein [Holophagaceae bacterium]
MKLYPFPESNWYMYLSGQYGLWDDKVRTFDREGFRLRVRLEGMEDDKNIARRATEWSRLRKAFLPYRHSSREIQVITDLGISNKFIAEYTDFCIARPQWKDEEYLEYYSKSKSIRAPYALVKGQPIGIRLFDLGQSKPFLELRYDDPGEPPKLWIREEESIPTWVVAKTNKKTGKSIHKKTKQEGFRAGISHGNFDIYDPHVSYDGGSTWSRCSTHTNTFSQEVLVACPNPIIRIIVHYRLRRYIKYYTYKIGFSDQPGGQYEPTTISESSQNNF